MFCIASLDAITKHTETNGTLFKKLYLFYSKGFWFRFWFHRNFWVSVSVSPKPKNGFRSITTLYCSSYGTENWRIFLGALGRAALF